MPYLFPGQEIPSEAPPAMHALRLRTGAAQARVWETQPAENALLASGLSGGRRVCSGTASAGGGTSLQDPGWPAPLRLALPEAGFPRGNGRGAAARCARAARGQQWPVKRGDSLGGAAGRAQPRPQSRFGTQESTGNRGADSLGPGDAFDATYLSTSCCLHRGPRPDWTAMP